MSERAQGAGIVLFCLKFGLFSALLLPLWWWLLQPIYVNVLGQVAGIFLRSVVQLPLEAVRVVVNEAGVLQSDTTLVYVRDSGEFPINVAYLVANVPPFVALVLATAGLGFARALKVLATGVGVLFVGQTIFIVIAFAYSERVERSPEIPTAFGLFLMTLPFLLWIVLAYWDRLGEFFEDAEPEKETPPE